MPGASSSLKSSFRGTETFKDTSMSRTRQQKQMRDKVNKADDDLMNRDEDDEGEYGEDEYYDEEDEVDAAGAQYAAELDEVAADKMRKTMKLQQ